MLALCIEKNELPKDKILHDKIERFFEPLRKFGELWNLAFVMSDEHYFSQFVKSKIKKHYPLGDSLSFDFYMVLKMNTSKEDWNKMMKDPEFSDVKNWFNDWVDVIINFHTTQISKVSKSLLALN